MAEEQELKGLVISFLQAELQKNPTGFSLQDFERIFPEASDESPDWYKQYGKKNTLEALQSIKDGIKIYKRFNQIFVSLDIQSDSVDNHLIDLITHQKQSKSKRKGPSRPSHKVYQSFSLNKHYDRRPRIDSYNRSDYSYTRPDYHTSHQQVSNHSETRSRSNNHQPMVPPQLQTKNYTTASLSSRSQSYHTPNQPAIAKPIAQHLTSSSTIRPSFQSSRSPSSQTPVQNRVVSDRTKSQQPERSQQLERQHQSDRQPQIERPKENRRAVEIDPILLVKKERLRQRLLHLLTQKHSEINVLHLTALYKLEFDENLSPGDYGHKAITDLIQDPVIGANVKLMFKSPFPTIKARSLSPITSNENNFQSIEETNSRNNPKKYSTAECMAIGANLLTPAKQKVDAIDIFNVRTMLQNLASISA